MLTQLVSTMARLIHFVSWFIFGCITFSLITWVVTLHPILWHVTKISLGFLIWINGWGIVQFCFFGKFSDDNKITRMGLMEALIYCIYIMLLFVCFGIGIGVVLCL